MIPIPQKMLVNLIQHRSVFFTAPRGTIGSRLMIPVTFFAASFSRRRREHLVKHTTDGEEDWNQKESQSQSQNPKVNQADPSSSFFPLQASPPEEKVVKAWRSRDNGYEEAGMEEEREERFEGNRRLKVDLLEAKSSAKGGLRPLKVAMQIQRALQEIFLMETPNHPLLQTNNIHILRVDMNRDLLKARVYWQPPPGSHTDEVKIQKEFIQCEGWLRHLLAQRVPTQFSPRLQFILERDEEEVKVEKLFALLDAEDLLAERRANNKPTGETL